jgi:hypothetical protein
LLSKISSLHPFIEEIVLKEDENQDENKVQVPLSILSYPKRKDILSCRDVKSDNDPKVNVFTELSKTNRKLFYLMFYHVLMDSRLNNVGNMYAVTDLFLFLQRKKFLGIYFYFI